MTPPLQQFLIGNWQISEKDSVTISVKLLAHSCLTKWFQHLHDSNCYKVNMFLLKYFCPLAFLFYFTLLYFYFNLLYYCILEEWLSAALPLSERRTENSLLFSFWSQEASRLGLANSQSPCVSIMCITVCPQSCVTLSKSFILFGSCFQISEKKAK